MRRIYRGGDDTSPAARSERVLLLIKRFIRPIVLGVYTCAWLAGATAAFRAGWPHLGASLVLLVAAFFQKVGWHVWLPLNDAELRGAAAGSVPPPHALRTGAAPHGLASAADRQAAGPRDAVHRRAGLAAPQQKPQASAMEILWNAPVSRTIH
jgi:hypothetical protein